MVRAFVRWASRRLRLPPQDVTTSRILIQRHKIGHFFSPQTSADCSEVTRVVLSGLTCVTMLVPRCLDQLSYCVEQQTAPCPPDVRGSCRCNHLPLDGALVHKWLYISVPLYFFLPIWPTFEITLGQQQSQWSDFWPLICWLLEESFFEQNWIILHHCCVSRCCYPIDENNMSVIECVV